MLLHDLNGDLFKPHRRPIERVAYGGYGGAIQYGGTEAWLTVEAGTAVHVGADTSRGVVRAQAANTATSRGTFVGPAMHWQSHMGIMFMLEGFATGAATIDELELSIASGVQGTADIIGASIVQGASAANPTARSLRGTTAAVSEVLDGLSGRNHVPSLKDPGPVNIGIAVFPQMGEWGMIGGDWDSPGSFWYSPETLTGWDQTLAGVVRPRISVKAGGTTQPTVTFGTARLKVWTP